MNHHHHNNNLDNMESQQQRQQPQKTATSQSKSLKSRGGKGVFTKRLSRMLKHGNSATSLLDTSVVDRLETCANVSGKLRTTDGTRLFFRRYTMTDMPKANIVILHSFGEHCGMYEHVCKRLMNSAYCIISFDQRGYGQSEGKRGHFSSFDKILTDISEIIQACIVYRDVPTFLYGHSSGGTAAILYALQLKEETRIKERTTDSERSHHTQPASSVTKTSDSENCAKNGAANDDVDDDGENNSNVDAGRGGADRQTSDRGRGAPSLSISTRASVDRRFASSTSSAQSSTGGRTGRRRYKLLNLAPIDGIIVTSPYLRLTVDSPSWQKKIIHLISKAYKSYLVQADISVFKLTKDKVMQRSIKDDPFRTSDITVKQLVEWEKKGAEAIHRAKEVDLPILLMHGSQDPVTDHRATHQFFSSCGSADKGFVALPNLLHNVHMEVDRERLVFSRIVRWLNRQVGRNVSPPTTPSSDASELRSTSLQDSDDDSIFHASSVSSGMLRNGLPPECRSTAPGTIIAGKHRPFHQSLEQSRKRSAELM